MKWIDAHIHIKDEPGLPLDDLMAAMRAIHEGSGLAATNILSIPSWDEAHVGQNLLGLLYKATYPEDTYLFAGLDYTPYADHPAERDFKMQLEAFLGLGADGVKLIESKPMVRKRIENLPFTDDAYAGFFSLLEARRVPVLWHVGDPETFWHRDQVSQSIIDAGWFYGDGSYPEKEALYREVESVLQRHPNIPVIFAHMFFLSADLPRADAFLAEHPQVYFDLTPGSEMYGNFALDLAGWRDFFVRHQDRIVFGTDGGWSTGEGLRVKVEGSVALAQKVRAFVETDDTVTIGTYTTQGVQLPTDVVEKILAGNFLRFVGGAPKPLNMPAALDYCDRMIDRLRKKAPASSDQRMSLDRAIEIRERLARL